MSTASITAQIAPGIPMVTIPEGRIVLKDEGSGRIWPVDVRPFLLSPVLLTRERYGELALPREAARAGADLPVTDVSWNEAIRFCNALSLREGLAPCYSGLGGPEAEGVRWDREAEGYRLPTEAEWEHACRAGSNDARYGALDEIAWHRGNSGDRLQPVGGKMPSAWGLFDMVGLAWEWCWDVYDPEVYGPYRVFRGGGFADLPWGCRASARRKSHPTFRIDDLGFRLARSLPRP